MDKYIASTEGGMINSFLKTSEMFCTLFGGADSLSCKVSNYRAIFSFLSRYFWYFITNRRITNSLQDVIAVEWDHTEVSEVSGLNRSTVLLYSAILPYRRFQSPHQI